MPHWKQPRHPLRARRQATCSAFAWTLAFSVLSGFGIGSPNRRSAYRHPADCARDMRPKFDLSSDDRKVTPRSPRIALWNLRCISQAVDQSCAHQECLGKHSVVRAAAHLVAVALTLDRIPLLHLLLIGNSG